MRKYYIRSITILGLSIILLVQFVWLANSYNFVRDELKIQSTNMLEQAVMEETFSRLQHLPIGTKVKSRTEEDKGKNLPEFVYMQESLEELKSPIILDSINHIYKQLLLKNNYPSECMISISKKDTIVQYIGNKPYSLFSLQTDKVPLRKDYSIVIQAQFTNPNGLFFGKMGLLLISTTILLIFVVFCIIYQVRIISKMNTISQIREDFSYAMIHDMKTPISSILMGIQILETGKLDTRPEKRAKLFHILKDESEHLLALTEKVLTLSKLENHQLNLFREMLSLRSMLDDLIEKFSAKADKPVHFSLALEAETVVADGEFLKEAISNLIDNAIKYSGASVAITISSFCKPDGAVVIKVKDNGFGIPLKDQSRIFEKYERASATERSRKGGASGFGLGLNYVFRVAEAHGGTVEVESIEGEYSEFSLSLPQKEFLDSVEEK